jgi:hypothetical protein
MAAGFDGRSAGIRELTDNYDTIVRLTPNAPATVLARLCLWRTRTPHKCHGDLAALDPLQQSERIAANRR